MDRLITLLALAAATAWVAAARQRWASLTAALVPLAAGAYFLLAWLRERQPPETGDAQPGLVLFVGTVVTLALAAAACAGWLLRARRRTH
jgi:hypothetical protein